MILNITPDHLDRHGSFENYALAKERIFAVQDANDFVVLNADNPRTAEAEGRSHAPVYWFSTKHEVSRGAWAQNGSVVYRSAPEAATETIMPLSKIPLKGEHNVENVLAAVCAARLAGVAASAIGRAIEKFHAVEHRLEYVATINDVEYYNDSKATNVDATAKAVASFPGGIHLILGGKDKGSDYATLAPLLREGCGRCIPLARRRPRSSRTCAAWCRFSLHDIGQRGERCSARRAARRRGAAGAGLLQLRPVRELRAARQGLQAACGGAKDWKAKQSE